MNFKIWKEQHQIYLKTKKNWLVLPRHCRHSMQHVPMVDRKVLLTAYSNTFGLARCPITVRQFIVFQRLWNSCMFGVWRPTTSRFIWSQPCNRNSFYWGIIFVNAGKRHNCIHSLHALRMKCSPAVTSHWDLRYQVERVASLKPSKPTFKMKVTAIFYKLPLGNHFIA